MSIAPVDLATVLATFDEPWSPRTVATVNDHDVRVVHCRGAFTPHGHPDTDELFLVLSGQLSIRLDDGEVTLGPGQMVVVPRGARHQPISPDGASVLLFEPGATVNTGDSPGALTAPRRQA
jgi:mannose-6-phosphate isomerase-like protein (cupin superfamily)